MALSLGMLGNNVPQLYTLKSQTKSHSGSLWAQRFTSLWSHERFFNPRLSQLLNIQCVFII